MKKGGGGGGAFFPTRPRRTCFPANVHVLARRVCEADVDEQRGRGEEVGVDLREGAGEVGFLGGGRVSGVAVLDFVEGHFRGGW